MTVNTQPPDHAQIDTATPERILDIATGYMAAKQLFAASRIHLFRALADGPLEAAGIAQATGVSEQIARTLADAMNSLGLLERSSGAYSLTDDAAAYLGGRGELDLGPYLEFLNQISYGHWQQFDRTVDTTTPGDLQMDEERWGTFMAGVMGYNSLHAAMLARQFDYTGFSSLLDLGGLSPDFALRALAANPQLQATFVYDPQSTEIIEKATAAAGVSDRITIAPEETATATPSGSHDLVMVNHVLHRFEEAQNEHILSSARAAAAPGATLLVLDFYLDDDEQQRRIDAVHAGEYFVIDGTIVYPQSQVEGWLTRAGWKLEKVLELPGSPRVLVATAQ